MVYKRVYLRDLFRNNIVTRSAMASFFESLKDYDEKELILDFSDILFISRSCADEYIKRKIDSKKAIVEQNLCDNVKCMFNITYLQYKKGLGLVA